MIERIGRGKPGQDRRRRAVRDSEDGHGAGDAESARQPDDAAEHRAVVCELERSRAQDGVGGARRDQVGPAAETVGALPDISQFAARRGDRDDGQVGEGGAAACRDRDVGRLLGDGDGRTGITGEITVIIKPGAHTLLQGVVTHIGAHCQTEEERVREGRVGRGLTIQDPIDPVGAGVAEEGVADAAEANPSVRIRQLRVGTPGAGARIVIIAERAFREIATGQLRINPRIDAGAKRVERRTDREARLVRSTQSIKRRHPHLHIEVTGLLGIDIAEAVEIAKNVAAAAGDFKGVGGEAVVVADEGRDGRGIVLIEARRFIQRVDIKTSQTRDIADGRVVRPNDGARE